MEKITTATSKSCGWMVEVWCMEQKVTSSDLTIDIDFFLLVECLFTIAVHICIITKAEILNLAKQICYPIPKISFLQIHHHHHHPLQYVTCYSKSYSAEDLAPVVFIELCGSDLCNLVQGCKEGQMKCKVTAEQLFCHAAVTCLTCFCALIIFVHQLKYCRAMEHSGDYLNQCNRFSRSYSLY